MFKDDKYISMPDLARTLGVTHQAIQKQLKGKITAGDIKVVMEGHKYLIEIESLPKEFRSRYDEAKRQAIKSAVDLVKKPQKDIHFEKDLWAAADKLRGNVDVSEYKHIVLGLLFLKYISDSFYNRHKELDFMVSDKKNEKYFIPNEKSRVFVLEDRDMYQSKGIFYIPESARWQYLRSKASQTNIAKYIDDAMDAIENENPQLLGILPKNYVRANLDAHILGELVNIFSRIDFGYDIRQEKDMLGRVYEYFLGQFADAEGKRGGEFFTPPPIVKLLVEVLEPFENSRVLDPCAGSGGMFVQSGKFLQKHHKDPTKIAIYGQESNQTT
ncbi:type I restriction-modification system subunit M, partial [Patescibacteria group bacterium]|nr:type I restriction-modification system subunit M [Patescibacteria group bacterium]